MIAEPDPQGWANVLPMLERAAKRRQLSPNTVRSYRAGLLDFAAFARGQGCLEPAAVTARVIESWQETLADRVRPSTCSIYATAVRRFIQWTGSETHLSPDLVHALARVRVPDGKPRPLPPHDLQLIKAYLAPWRRNMDIVSLRDRALFFYLLTTGARVSEALQVKRDDYLCPVVVQKGGSQKELRIPPIAAEFVGDYVRARRDDSQWLWISHKTNAPLGRLGPAGVREVWRKLARKLGIAPWQTHQLRHTCATELLDAGVRELAVAEHLGHHGLGSLHIYGQIRGQERQASVEAMQRLVTDTTGRRLLPSLTSSRWS